MKKVIFLFLLLFLVNVKAEEKTFIEYEYIDGFYYNGYVNGEKISYNAMYMEHEGETLYCLGFGIPISKQIGYSKYEFYSNSGYQYEQNVYIEVIAYFGYGYNNTNNINYYLAAQELIWNSLGIDMYWTGSLNGTDIIDLTPYKNNILKYYNEYINESSFSVENYSMEVGNSYFIQDPNTYLKPYTFWYGGNNEIIQSSEGLMINALISGQDYVQLERHIGGMNPSELYLEPGFQPVVKPGHTQGITRVINFDIKNSSIHFTRTNMAETPTLKNNNLKLENAVYELYDIGFNYITTFTTDEEGKATIENLPIGSYKVKEITPSYGYAPFSEYLCPSIHMGNAPAYERLYAYPIIKELNIENIYKIDGVEYREENIKFELYRDNSLFGIYSTDNQGKIKIGLEYGNYLIKQISSKDSFELEPEFNVIVNEKDNNLNYIFVKEKTTIIPEEIIETPTIEEPIDENEEQTSTDDTTNIENKEQTSTDYPTNKETEQVDNIIKNTDNVIIKSDEIIVDYDNNVNIEISELPQLNSVENIWEIICEKLSLLYFQYY